VDDPNPQPPEIVVVASRVSGRGEVGEILRHELTHAADHCIRRMDLRDCDALACSEVRAHLNAECSVDGSRVHFAACSGPLRFVNAQWCEGARLDCARRHAVRATSNVFPAHDAQACVQRVFERCRLTAETEDALGVDAVPASGAAPAPSVMCGPGAVPASSPNVAASAPR